MGYQIEKNQLIEQILLYFKQVKERDQIIEEIEGYKKVTGKYPFDIVPWIVKGVAYFIFALIAFIIYRNIMGMNILDKLAEATMTKFDNELGEIVANLLRGGLLKWIFAILYIWIMYSIARLMDGVFDGIYQLTARYVKKYKKGFLKEQGLENLKKNQHVIQELVRRMKEKDMILKESRFIPQNYMKSDALSKFLLYLESGRCETLGQCIETYETEFRYEQLLQEIRDIKAILKMEE